MRLLTTAAIFLAASIPGEAGHRHHHHHHRQYAEHHHVHTAHHARHRAAQPSNRRELHARQRQHNSAPVSHGGGMVTVPTAAGSIAVTSHIASRFQALIADFVTASYKPRRIGCLAHGGHVPNSRHYAGAACDSISADGGLPPPSCTARTPSSPSMGSAMAAALTIADTWTTAFLSTMRTARATPTTGEAQKGRVAGPPFPSLKLRKFLSFYPPAHRN